jgi:O6-methylguanine-DNA--protein-cysteine methyltransferase
LTADLAERFPKNTIVRDDRKLEGDIEKILRFIETPARGLDLELDVHGTPFQRRVWDALCGIPAGRMPRSRAASANRERLAPLQMPVLPMRLRLRSRVIT